MIINPWEIFTPCLCKCCQILVSTCAEESKAQQKPIKSLTGIMFCPRLNWRRFVHNEENFPEVANYNATIFTAKLKSKVIRKLVQGRFSSTVYESIFTLVENSRFLNIVSREKKFARSRFHENSYYRTKL